MKEKFLSFIGKYVSPWKDGSTGTPWSFPTWQLVVLGNSNLPPDIIIDKEGNPLEVLLTADEVVEVMTELGFKQEVVVDPWSGMSTKWEVELSPNLIM